MSAPDLNPVVELSSLSPSTTEARRARKRMPRWLALPLAMYFYGVLGGWLLINDWTFCGWVSLAVAAFELVHLIVYIIIVLFSKK